jgi:hypothetical protein
VAAWAACERHLDGEIDRALAACTTALSRFITGEIGRVPIHSPNILILALLRVSQSGPQSSF